MDTKENEININNDILENEEDSISLSFNSENNNYDWVPFNNITFYDELNYNFNIDFIGNEKKIDEK